MSAHSESVRYSLLVGAVAALCALLYAQFGHHLPDALQVSNPHSLRQQYPSCALVGVPPDHLFVAASVWEGGFQSGLVLGGVQSATKIVPVHVSPGDKPITAFLSGYGVIFSFSGAVDRIQRVVAMSQFMNKMVGVAGVPADRVVIPAHNDCPYAKDAIGLDNDKARSKALAVMLGRRPDRDAYQRTAAFLSLPEASFEFPRDPGPVPPQRALKPGDVIAAVPVSQPATLPGATGLARLEGEGAIRRPTDEEVKVFLTGASLQYRSKLSPDFLLQAKFDYAITREVTLPNGLLSEPRFLLLPGVPKPPAPYQGCFAETDGFRFNSVIHCFPASYDGIEGLKRMPSPQELGPCRLFRLPEEVPLHAVAVYEPAQPFRGFKAAFDGEEKAYPIDVHVEHPGEMVLVLNTYRPAIWRISVAPGSRVAAVVSISYHPSQVEGVAPGTPIMMTDIESARHGPNAAGPCMGMRGAGGEAYRGGPDAMVFDRKVQALTGRSLDSLRGAHKLERIVIP